MKQQWHCGCVSPTNQQLKGGERSLEGGGRLTTPRKVLKLRMIKRSHVRSLGFFEQGATAWDGTGLVELPLASAQAPRMQLMSSDLCLLD